ncbi:unnamed protein product [Staurois parvus]|uniref:Uncharacterized protein n=1 Tax=Staurois parvus TaxID=386267 RepID=A0ABN9AS26_9NEOB|nr:unnamed protein product [Staurois parvus]
MTLGRKGIRWGDQWLNCVLCAVSLCAMCVLYTVSTLLCMALPVCRS